MGINKSSVGEDPGVDSMSKIHIQITYTINCFNMNNIKIEVIAPLVQNLVWNVYFHTTSFPVWWRGIKPLPGCAKFIQTSLKLDTRPFLAGISVCKESLIRRLFYKKVSAAVNVEVGTKCYKNTLHTWNLGSCCFGQLPSISGDDRVEASRGRSR
jgi:hypothetical protein